MSVNIIRETSERIGAIQQNMALLEAFLVSMGRVYPRVGEVDEMKRLIRAESNNLDRVLHWSANALAMNHFPSLDELSQLAQIVEKFEDKILEVQSYHNQISDGSRFMEDFERCALKIEGGINNYIVLLTKYLERYDDE